MEGRHRDLQVSGSAIITDDDASVELIAAANPALYLYINEIMVSVYEASEGGNGILEISDNIGTVAWRINVSAVKDVRIKLGTVRGKQMGQDVSVNALLSGAATQASVAVAVHGEYSRT